MSTEIEDFIIIGIAIQTTNKNGQAEEDLGGLWGRFYAEGISAAIPNKDSDEGLFLVYGLRKRLYRILYSHYRT